jgi:hypothetical protein
MPPEQALIREPPVHAHRPLRLGPEAVIGEEHHVRLGTCRLDQPANGLVELVVDGEERGPHLLVQLTLGGTVRVDVLPEVVLHPIRRVEDHAHAVGRARRHHAQRGLAAQPGLPAHAVQVGQRALVVVGIGAPQVLRGREIDLVLAELARHLGRVGELRARRRQHAAHQVAAGNRTQRVRRRHVDHADPLAGVGRDVPDAHGAQVAGVGEPCRVVAVVRHAMERVHAVAARILPRHERRPGRQRERRDGGGERAPAAALHQASERGQPAGARPRRQQPPGGAVEPDHEYAGRQARGR